MNLFKMFVKKEVIPPVYVTREVPVIKEVPVIVKEEVHIESFKLLGSFTWSKDDSDNLQSFFTSETGRKFVSNVNDISCKINEWAVKSEPNKDYSNASGFASGYKECFNSMIRMADLKKISDSDLDTKAEESLIERLKA